MWVKIASVSIISVVGLGIYYTISVYRTIKKYKNVPGFDYNNGIMKFFVGDINIIVNAIAKGKNLVDLFYDEMVRLNTKTIKIRIYNQVLVITSDPRIIKETLIEQDFEKHPQVYKNAGFPGGERYLGKGLVTEANKKNWKHRRALFDPGFHKQVLKRFMNEFNEKGDVLIEHLKLLSLDEKEPIKLLEKFNRTALDIIASTAFSIDVDSINDTNNFLIHDVHESLVDLEMYNNDPLIKLKPHKWPAIIRHRKTVRRLRDFGRKHIEARIKAFLNGDDLPDDILTVILKSHEKEDFNLEEMVDDFITFFIAGQETTASTLASAFLAFGRDAVVLEKLRNEVYSVLGSKEEIEFEDLSKMTYIGCVIKEALRLYCPAPYIVRRTEKDLKYDDIYIPEDSMIFINIYGSGRLEDVYPDSLKFNPERFMKKDNEIAVNYNYIPFSLGSRMCIGQNFAKMEMKVIIAKLIQNFDFRLDENQSFELKQASTIRPKDGTKCFLTIRN